MSASNKKKLRKEQNAAALSEKQKREQKEARKLKLLTLIFVIVMIVAVTVPVGFWAAPQIDGMILRNADAIIVGDHTLSTAELTYFYYDAITEHQSEVYNTYYSSFGSYWSIMLGFDTTKPLNEQSYDSDRTWADYFMDTAIETARDTYALYDDAIAKGHTLTDDEQTSLDSYLSTLELYATYYGYSSVKSYLRANYGNGATEDNYKEYYEICTLASSYLTKYAEDLEYDLDDYRAYEADKYDDYSVVSYIHYTMKYSTYLGEGTTDEDGNTTWTDEEKDAARAAMKADMEALLAGEVTDKESFDAAIQAWEINQLDKDTTDSDDSSTTTTTTTTLPTSTEVTGAYFGNISLHAAALEWLQETGRTPGEIKAFEVYTYADHEDAEHEHGDECGCDRTVDGYTIVLFVERDDQTTKMVNVRHILVAFEGGTEDADGNTTYSEEEKAAALEEAEALLQKWKDGKANEDSFAELANAESDDNNGNVTNGGLYEDIYPGQMVEAFEDWCFDPERQAGDTGLVETEYGWHVMYFVSYDEMSYRDLLIDSDLRVEDTEKWHDGLVENAYFEIVSLDKMKYDYVVED